MRRGRAGAELRHWAPTGTWRRAERSEAQAPLRSPPTPHPRPDVGNVSTSALLGRATVYFVCVPRIDDFKALVVDDGPFVSCADESTWHRGCSEWVVEDVEVGTRRSAEYLWTVLDVVSGVQDRAYPRSLGAQKQVAFDGRVIRVEAHRAVVIARSKFMSGSDFESQEWLANPEQGFCNPRWPRTARREMQVAAIDRDDERVLGTNVAAVYVALVCLPFRVDCCGVAKDDLCLRDASCTMQRALVIGLEGVRRSGCDRLDVDDGVSGDCDIWARIARLDRESEVQKGAREAHLPHARVELSAPLELVVEVGIGIRAIPDPKALEVGAVILAQVAVAEMDESVVQEVLGKGSPEDALIRWHL